MKRYLPLILGAVALALVGTYAFPSTTINGDRTVSGALTVSGHTVFEGVTSTGATGTGNIVYATSPTLTTPALGTPSALVLTSATGLPAAQVLSGALVNGMTATTQSANDNSTKLATTAYVNGIASTGTGPSASAYLAGTQSITNGTNILLFDTNLWDTCSACTIHSTSTNNGRFVAPTTGYYLATCGLQTTTSSVGLFIYFAVNGTTQVTGNGHLSQVVGNALSGEAGASITTILKMTANDYMNCIADSTSTVSSVAGQSIGQLTKLSTTF